MRGILVLAALGGLADRLPAQAAPPPSPSPFAPLERGSRVQVRVLTGSGEPSRPVEGTIERISRDTLVLQPRGGGHSQAFPAVPGTVVSVFNGRRSSLTKGAFIGGLTGLAIGGVVWAFAPKSCQDTQAICFSRRQVAFTGGIVLGVIGTGTGLLVGALTSHDSWTATSGPSAWPYLSVRTGGLDAGLSVIF